MMTINFQVGSRAVCQEYQWSDWYWLERRIVRHNSSAPEQFQECHDINYLRDQHSKLKRLKHALMARSTSAPESQKNERNIKEMDKQIEYLRERLATLEASSAPEPVESAKPSSVLIEVVESSKLTEDEQQETLSQEELRLRLQLEQRVERAFYEACKALRELRNRQLYRSTHKTFEEYCRDRFGFERRHSYRLIDAAIVFERLASQELNATPTETTTVLGEMCPIGTQVLPTSERQIRPLTKLHPEQQIKAWQQAVYEADSEVPSGRIVEDIVQRIKKRTPVPNPYHVGEICWLVAKGDPQLKGKNRCWAVIKDVHEFSCTVQTWDGVHQVKIENLKSQALLPSQREQLKQMGERLQRLACLDSLAQSLRPFLKKLGEQLSFDEVEEQMLSFLENYYLNKNGQASKTEESFFLDDADIINDSCKDLEPSAMGEIPQGAIFGNQLQAIGGKEDDNE